MTSIIGRSRFIWIYFVLQMSFSTNGSSSLVEHRNHTTWINRGSESSYSLENHLSKPHQQIPDAHSRSNSGHSSQSPSLFPTGMGITALQVASSTLEDLERSRNLQVSTSVLESLGHGRNLQVASSTMDDLERSRNLQDGSSVLDGLEGDRNTHRSYTRDEAAKINPKGPYFELPQTTEVNTRAGQSVTLNCIVRQLGNRQVSWIRGRDLHVLSSGQVAFSSDSRVSVAHTNDSWTLTIRYTQLRDAGSYLCQVNTQPRIATKYTLTVTEARANIEGKERLYVQAGSTVTLECIIKEELVIPGLVLWYQNDRLVERDSGRIQVVTKVTNSTISTLTMTGAENRDSGNYSCWPSAGRPDSVIVHVIQGDPPAAMQHGNSASGFSNILLIPTNIVSLLFLFT